MVTPRAGSGVLVPLAFSDLSPSKCRPGVVLASIERGDWILSQVTANSGEAARPVKLKDDAFKQGSLRPVSSAWPAKLFTAHASPFASEAGVLSAESLRRITDEVVSVIQRSPCD